MNQYLERDIDNKMKRTEHRPIPSGRLTARSVLYFGVVVAIAGVLEMFFFVDRLAGMLGLLTFLSYAFLYTPLKRKTVFNTFIGAVPGALPPVMGWRAGGGGWDIQPLALFLIMFVWQLPHFFAIAWVYQEDYRKSGLKMLPAEDPDGLLTSQRILFYTCLLMLTTLLPVWSGDAGLKYLVPTFLAGMALIVMAAFLWARRLEGSKRFVTASIYYLFIVMVSLLVDKR